MREWPASSRAWIRACNGRKSAAWSAVADETNQRLKGRRSGRHRGCEPADMIDDHRAVELGEFLEHGSRQCLAFGLHQQVPAERRDQGGACRQRSDIDRAARREQESDASHPGRMQTFAVVPAPGRIIPEDGAGAIESQPGHDIERAAPVVAIGLRLHDHMSSDADRARGCEILGKRRLSRRILRIDVRMGVANRFGPAGGSDCRAGKHRGQRLADRRTVPSRSP